MIGDRAGLHRRGPHHTVRLRGLLRSPARTMARRARLGLLLSLAALALSGAPALARQTIELDGKWECVFAEAKSPPAAGAAWQPVMIPSTQEWKSDGPHFLWYRKRVYVPPSWAGQRIFLMVGGAKYSQQVYLNGKAVGQHLGGFEPTEYDLTDQALVGSTNELLIAVQDWTALLGKGAKPGPVEAAREFGSWVRAGIVAPLGPRGWEVGIWGSVSLQARPRVWVADVFVIPSVRQGTLRVSVTLRNGGVDEQQTTVTARVATGGGGPRFEPKTMVIAGGKEQAATLEAAWSQPRLWSPQDPHLYSVVVGARTGRMGDSTEVTFGFREFWAEGDRFVLNGVPLHLTAAAVLQMPDHDADPNVVLGRARSLGCTAVAFQGQPWPSQWYDAADSAGMLVISESALWRLSPSYALASNDFWKNAREHLSAQIKALRNHPSVVIWTAEDDLLAGGGTKVKGTEQKLGELADLIRATDPSRLVMFEGDADPVGKADIVNLHHPHELAQWRQWPEAAYWYGAPAKLDSYPGTVWEWDHRKPLYLGEFGRVAPAEAADILFGDTIYPDVEGAGRQAEILVRETQTIAARDAGVSGICAWHMDDPRAWSDRAAGSEIRACLPTAVFAREAGTHVFAGTVIERTLMVFNDTPVPRSLDLRWRLAPADGAWQVTGSMRLRLGPADRERVVASLALPPTTAEVTTATFSAELWEGGSRVSGSSQDWKVYGRSALSGRPPAAPAQVPVYDPPGETTRLLSQMGIESLSLSRDNARRLFHSLPLMVIGKGALTTIETADEWLLLELQKYVAEGGSLLVFEQERYPDRLIPITVTGTASTITFPRLAGHPALAGLEAADLVQWLPDGLVTRREIAKPTRGGFLAVVDSGSAAGLETAGLAELRVGNGRILLCQLDVTGKFGLDPVATRIVRNLLVYAAERPRRAARTGVFCDDAVAQKLDVIGLEYDRLTWPLSKGTLHSYQVLLIANPEPGIGEPARVEEFVRGGGRVVLQHVTPTALPTVQRLLGQRVGLRPMGSEWLSLSDRAGPAAGLSNEDLAWVGAVPGGVAPPESVGIADYILSPVAEVTAPITLAPTPPTYHTAPGLLVSSRLGRGLWVVDEVRWDRPGPNEAKADRYLSTLLTNLGCEFIVEAKPPAR